MSEKNSLFSIGIVGAAGYTAGELLRILIHHPRVVIKSLQSESNSGKPVCSVHNDLLGFDQYFVDSIDPTLDVIFLCKGHGFSEIFLSVFKPENPNQIIIDLSRDYRASRKQFTYGLAAMNKELIKRSKYIANPGCFATAIQLALLPLASKKLLNSDIHCTAITGSSGAGQKPMPTTHYSWRNNNISTYKVFVHQHEKEIMQSLKEWQSDLPNLWFTPIRGNHVRGIFGLLNMKTDISLPDLSELYRNYYASHPFVHLMIESIHLKMVVNTNNCALHLQKKDNMLQITSAIDNLILGASGQAVQNMNLALGLAETSGLGLKSSGL